jgi:hypothetical protein
MMKTGSHETARFHFLAFSPVSNFETNLFSSFNGGPAALAL